MDYCFTRIFPLSFIFFLLPFFSKCDSDLGCVGMIYRVYGELESGKVAGRIVLDVTK